MRFLKTLLFIFGLSFTLPVLAQDTIVLKTGERFVTKIITIDPDFVTYKLTSDLDGPTITTRKSEIKTVTLKSGSVLKFKNTHQSDNFTPTVESEILDSKKNSLKWEIFSLVTNDLCFGYERSIGKGNSLELKAAIIGVGNSNIEGDYYSKSTSGYFFKLGYKSIKSRSGNPKSLIGAYVKPEICYTSFTINDRDFKSKYAMINLGKTFSTSKSFTLEFYAGIGVCYNDLEPVQYSPSLSYSGYNPYIDTRTYFYSNSTIGDGRNHEISACGSCGLLMSFNF